MPDTPDINIPIDLTLSSTDELRSLEEQAIAEFTRLGEEDDVTPEALQAQMELAEGIDRLKAELAGREERDRQTAAREKARLADERQRLQNHVLGQPEAPAGGDGGDGSAPAATTIDTEALATAVASAVAQVMVGGQSSGPGLTAAAARSASLSDAQRHAPQPKAPASQLSIVASVEVPGVESGKGISSVADLANLMHRKARTLPPAHGSHNYQTVATIKNTFEHTVDDRTPVRDIEELFRYLTRDEKKDALVAAGGWCAPSENRYDFFNIACTDGLIDLPTFGVSRGGINYPVSPSLADVFDGIAFGGFSTTFSNASVPWLWTESDDELAVTGDGTKPCIRIPCPDFEERRLECAGLCLTAGNLTDDAYPENTQNFLRLLMAAHDHAVNGRIISTMASLSEAAVTGGSFAVGGPAFNAVVSGLSLAATDYRARYGMCEEDIIEVVSPNWVLGLVQADLARRSGVDMTSVARAQIRAAMADRNVRVQFVNDWQVRGSGQFGHSTKITAWPHAATFMVYAAGTFIRGNGLNLDLGVVRDSTLNATNDHTAAWSEECFLVAKVGHASRQYTVAFDVAGDTCCIDLATEADSPGLL